MTLTGELTWQRLRRSSVPGILVENRRFNLPHLYLGPSWHFAAIFGIRKLERLPSHMVQKYRAGRFFGLATKHACDRRTDRITTPKTALSIARTVKSSWSRAKMNSVFWHQHWLNADIHCSRELYTVTYSSPQKWQWTRHGCRPRSSLSELITGTSCSYVSHLLYNSYICRHITRGTLHPNLKETANMNFVLTVVKDGRGRKLHRREASSCWLGTQSNQYDQKHSKNILTVQPHNVISALLLMPHACHFPINLVAAGKCQNCDFVLQEFKQVVK